MRKVNVKEVEELLYQTILQTCVSLTPQCENALALAKEKESSPLCAFALDTLIENAKIAKSEKLPVCQDTGLAVVFAEIGQDVFFEGGLFYDAINNAVSRAYIDGSFRKSSVDPLTRENSLDNTPAIIHTDIVKGDKITLSFIPKGFGSENMSKIYMLTPAVGKEGIVDSVVEACRLAGGKPCPPITVGVGIGGDFELCAILSKKALLRPIGEHNKRADVKQLEIEILEKINKLNIGALGLKGDTTAFAVNIEVANTHIAGLPVAINIQCNSNRVKRVVL